MEWQSCWACRRQLWDLSQQCPSAFSSCLPSHLLCSGLASCLYVQSASPLTLTVLVLITELSTHCVIPSVIFFPINHFMETTLDFHFMETTRDNWQFILRLARSQIQYRPFFKKTRKPDFMTQDCNPSCWGWWGRGNHELKTDLQSELKVSLSSLVRSGLNLRCAGEQVCYSDPSREVTKRE